MKKFLLSFCLFVIAQNVFADCHADFTYAADGLTVAFDDISTADPGPVFSWSWDFGDGTTSDAANPTHIYAEPGEYLVCLTIHAEGACVEYECKTIVVDEGGADCHASFEYEGDCLTLHFFDESSGGDVVSYTWDFGDGDESDDANPVHTFDEEDTYTVCLIIETASGCVDYECIEIEVEDCGGGDCEAEFEFEEGDAGHVFFDANTSGGDADSYAWDFGDGTTGTGEEPAHVYTESGVYIVCLYVTFADGCTAEYCHEVVVELGGGGDCIVTFDVTAIDGLALHFFGSVEPYSEEVTYTWSWGDGSYSTETSTSEGTDPWHDYVLAGTYTVCLYITTASGCTDSICEEIIVGGETEDCTASFDYETADGGLVYFDSATDPGPGDVDTYWWSFGDGTFSDDANPHHTYTESGEYDVCLVVTFGSGCIAEYCYTIYVEVPDGSGDCYANFEWSGDCLTLHFFEAISGFDIASYYWQFGDGATSDAANPTHTFTEDGIYTVCLAINAVDGCTADTCFEIEVTDCGSGDCSAGFSWTSDGTTISFVASTEPGPGDVESYSWDFGDGSEGSGYDPSHEYDEPGTYTVCIMVIFTTGCVATYCHEVEVSEGGGGSSDCEAYFNILSTIPDGTGWIVTFNNESIADAGVGDVIWYFGDGSFAETYDATHYYEEPGEYNVCLVIVSEDGECTDEYCTTITVGEGSGECEADFTWTHDGSDFTFTSASDAGGSIIISYIWSFDDGTFSFDENPDHTFPDAGEYEVCLSIIALDSCFDTHCEIVHVEEEAEECVAFFEVDAITESEEGWVVDFSNESTGSSDHFEWYYGDGVTEEIFDGVHLYTEPGIYHVCMTIGIEGSDCYDEYCMDIFIGSDEDCQDESIIDTTVTCSGDYAPVCGCDGETYTNECVAHYYHGILFWTEGACTTALTDVKKNADIKIYPNPASDKVNVVLNSTMHSNAVITLQDMLGNTLINIYAGSISGGTSYYAADISNLPDGMYFVTASMGEKGMVTQKLLITNTTK